MTSFLSCMWQLTDVRIWHLIFCLTWLLRSGDLAAVMEGKVVEDAPVGRLNDFLVHSDPVLFPQLLSRLWLCRALAFRSSLTVQFANLQFHTTFVTIATKKTPTKWKICWISHQICVLLVSSQTHACILSNLCNGLVCFQRVLEPELQFPAVAISPSLTLFASDPGLVVGQEDFFPIHTSSSAFSESSSGVQNEPRLN